MIRALLRNLARSAIRAATGVDVVAVSELQAHHARQLVQHDAELLRMAKAQQPVNALRFKGARS